MELGLDQGMDQQQDISDERKLPKDLRDEALLPDFAGDPLHQKTCCERKR